MTSAKPQPVATGDPEWFRTAVFYEVMLRAFADSTGSGSGDLRGLIAHLDYLQWLGVDALWLPPFYPSPLRDGGYDVADFSGVAEQYGTIDDFADLISQAHARGIRIVIDLVMNHTSDAHPWFQASRSDPAGPFGDYYVWSDTADGYQEARIIFVDTETSNWTYDEVRGQYFWHRFFSHQPDLNFENPAVRAAMMDVARLWLGLGIDGFRLDAVPYLFEQEGTNGENLPQTHEYLAELRAMVDAEFPGAVLLAEANQWPRDVVDYFGSPEAPECHMCFHFPVMPRIYYAIKDERAGAIVDILADTPPLPAGGQWGTFLRNHDELTLEMVSDDERAAMYRWFAPQDRMRANVGIRRRLAPLLDNSRALIELANVLLLSLPGSPCLYYGDEIGMGDNIWLPDRDAVRTPMQWSDGPNGGFSTAEDTAQLYLPVIDTPAFAAGAVNVADQREQPDSLLNWTRRMLAVRRSHPVFGQGEYRAVAADDPAVLAYLRSDSGETVLCVANLASQERQVSISVPTLASAVLADLITGEACGAVDADGRLDLQLGARGYLWLAEAP